MEQHYQYIINLIKRLEARGSSTSKWAIVDNTKININVISVLDAMVKQNILTCENGQYRAIEEGK